MAVSAVSVSPGPGPRAVGPAPGVLQFIQTLPFSCSMLDFSIDGSEEFDINAFEDIFAFYESKK